MTSKNIYIHLDLETASINPSTGKLWAIGAVVTDEEYSILDKIYIESLPIPALWDNKTLTWAIDTYGQAFLDRLNSEGRGDFRYVWQEILPVFTEWVELLGRVYETDQIHSITNHPNFDIAFLQTAYHKRTQKMPFKYNYHWDMQSLLMGATGQRGDDSSLYKLLNEGGFSKENVTHNAVEDALRQCEILKHFKVKLPKIK